MAVSIRLFFYCQSTDCMLLSFRLTSVNFALSNMNNKIVTIFLFSVISLTSYSCCTLGLVAIAHRYVNGDKASDPITINISRELSPIELIFYDGRHFGSSDFAMFIRPYKSNPEDVKHIIEICVKELTLDNYDKKTAAQIYLSGQGIVPIDRSNMCMDYRFQKGPEGVAVFKETHHMWNSKAVIEGILSIYRDGKYLNDIHFKHNLKKKSFRPICLIADV